MPKNHFHISHLLIHQKRLFPFPGNLLPASAPKSDTHCTFKPEWSTPEWQYGWLIPRATIKNHTHNPTRKLYVNEPHTAAPGTAEFFCLILLLCKPPQSEALGSSRSSPSFRWAAAPGPHIPCAGGATGTHSVTRSLLQAPVVAPVSPVLEAPSWCDMTQRGRSCCRCITKFPLPHGPC